MNRTGKFGIAELLFVLSLLILIVIVAMIMVAEIISGWARKVFQ